MFLLRKFKRPDRTEFTCTNRQTKEDILTNIVLQFNMIVPGDLLCLPTFFSEKCIVLMNTKFFIGYSGITYRYDGN